jgi:hypothetical protein
MSQMVERRVSRLDAEENLRNPNRTYQSRQGRTVAEKAFEGYVVRVVILSRRVRSVRETRPSDGEDGEATPRFESFYQGIEELADAPPAESPEAGGARHGYSIATVVTVVKRRRKTRMGNGSP